MQVNNNVTLIRCFDLGGGGLKTGLLSHDSTTGEMKIVQDEVKLGKCPSTEKVESWIRREMLIKGMNLDNEISQGALFGFSLAGIEKLFESRTIEQHDPLPKLFKLPSDKVSSISDGSAHTLASVKMLKQQLSTGKIWNFSIGTGVGMGFTDAQNNLHTNQELRDFFDGKNPWDVKVPNTGKAVHDVCSSKTGFDRLLIEGKSESKAFEIFATRWKDFIEKQIIEHAENKALEVPTAVIFTGGNIDYYGDKLVDAINKQGLKIHAFKGPDHAALYGAAFDVIQKTSASTSELKLKLPENADVLYNRLGLEPHHVVLLKNFIKETYAKDHLTDKKYEEGDYPNNVVLPRPLEYHKDGRVTITLKGGEEGCSFKEGDLFDLIEGNSLPIEGKILPKEKSSDQQIEFRFSENVDDLYRELGLDVKQAGQIKQFIEETYANNYKTNKKYTEGQKAKVWLPRPVEYYEDGRITIKLLGGELGCKFQEGDLFDPITGEFYRKT
jgi:hypothetical protein